MLPVESVSDHLINALQQGNGILVAPPGAGKSTCLPLKLLAAEQFKGEKILMLQPRRVVVRSIAAYLAQQLGEAVGQTVGYRIRGESKTSKHTRLEIVTEGLLTRMLQQDPELNGVGLVIFDEFHERSLHADFSLALSIEAQQGLREDLRLLVMSATLDVQPLARLLPDSTLIESEGRSFPITLHHGPMEPRQRLDTAVTQLCHRVLQAHSGNVLVFLPGKADILKVAEHLSPLCNDTLTVCPLYGELDKKQQHQAIAPTAPGQRKVVLATNIAETSLTIEGIEVVIDSGLEKVAIFHLNRGVTQLKQQMISQASATQRAGRAGRLGPGHCYRMWSAEQHHRLAKQSVPQILHSELAPLMLEAASWGSTIDQLPLLDIPSKAQQQQGLELLQDLNAVDGDGKITAHGQQLNALAPDPRLGHMLKAAQELDEGAAQMACVVAAMLEHNASSGKGQTVGAEQRLLALLKQRHHPMWQSASLWAKRLGIRLEINQLGQHTHWLAILLAMAYPDRIAKGRGDGRFALASGSGAMLDRNDPLATANWLAVGDMMLAHQADAWIGLAQPVTTEELETQFAHLITDQVVCQWDKQTERITARKQRRLKSLVLQNDVLPQPPEQQCLDIWCQEIQRRGLDALPISDNATRQLSRARFARQLLTGEQWPDLSDQWLLSNLAAWLGPYLSGLRQWRQLAGLDWLSIINSVLGWDRQQQLQRLLPEKFTVPSGSNITLEYRQQSEDCPGDVVLSVKMTEMYGMNQHPCIADGRIPLTVELLSPALRPIQTTRDLPGFWQGSYKAVQKDMRARYIKHFWPDDPATAPATRKTKRNM